MCESLIFQIQLCTRFLTYLEPTDNPLFFLRKKKGHSQLSVDLNLFI